MSAGARSRRDLGELVQGFADLRVWVAGDIMLDEYIVGDVARISPEAPVPVVRVRDRMKRLGGATNVARQIRTLGGAANLCGIVGSDVAGADVLAACAEQRIDTSAVGRLEDRKTTHKIRVLGPHQQLMRLDWEEPSPCPDTLAAELVNALRDGEPPHAVVLSDYAKGFLSPHVITRLIDLAREHGVPVLVDPKRRDLEAYRGATVVTPNLHELEQVVGSTIDPTDDRAVAAASREALAGSDIGAMVVTLGERGMIAVRAGRDGHAVIRAQRRAVFDITGAGDTAIAVLALGLAAGASLEDAARVANTAAGISVGDVGAVSVSPAELIAGVMPRRAGKVLSRRSLAAQVEAWRLQGKRVVFTNGCFDLLHVGHLSLLNEAARLGDVLVLAINSDDSVRRLKGDDRPLVPEEDRAALLAALDCIDAVTVFDEDTPLEIIRMVRPDILVKGQDYRLDQVVGREEVEAGGGTVELVRLLPDHSTTDLIERIRRSSHRS